MNHKIQRPLPKNVIAIRSFFDWITAHPFQILGIGLLLFLFISLLFVPYQVNLDQVGIVRRFGRFLEPVKNPGLHFRLPWGIDEVTLVDVKRIHKLEIKNEKEEADSSNVLKEYFTGDITLIDVLCTIQYQIDDAPSFLFHAQDPLKILLKQAQETMINELGIRDKDDILSRDKSAIQKAILETLKEVIKQSNFGISLLSANLESVRPPPESETAFQDVMNAQEERYLSVNLAEINKIQVFAKAHGLANEIVSLAKAETFSVIKKAEAASQKFGLLLAQNQNFPAETAITEYYKMVDKVLSQTNVFVLRKDQGAHLDINLLNQVLPPKPDKTEGKPHE